MQDFKKFFKFALFVLGVFLFGFMAGYVTGNPFVIARMRIVMQEIPKFILFYWYVALTPAFLGTAIGLFWHKVNPILIGITLSLVVSCVGTYFIVFDPDNFSFIN